MNAEKILEKYVHHTQRWLEETDTFTPETFSKHPPGEWSTAQVIDHICKTTHKCIELAIICSNKNGEQGHSGFGPALFSFMRSFPPVRIRVKEPPKEAGGIYDPQHISQAEARMALKEALLEMKNTLPAIQSADMSYRMKHWAGGWFNTLQWYHSAEMHIKHHFRQLERIQKYIEKIN